MPGPDTYMPRIFAAIWMICSQDGSNTLPSVVRTNLDCHCSLLPRQLMIAEYWSDLRTWARQTLSDTFEYLVRSKLALKAYIKDQLEFM